ncbi:MAG: cyclic nucleotide-binding domain-containing protein [Pedosphaera sp.]|nr:cyclic nucleotide-binding domain-containing protein [Pedosphaera sp.]
MQKTFYGLTFYYEEEKTYAAGETILRQGDEGKKLFVLAKGSVEIIQGTRRVATCAERGALFGEMSALLNSPYTASVRAVEPTTVYIVHDVEDFMRSQPETLLFVAKMLARRLSESNNKALYYSIGSKG